MITSSTRHRITERARPHAGGWVWNLDGIRAWSKEHPALPPAANSNAPSWRAEWAEMIAKAVA